MSQSNLPTYADRKEQFRKVRLRILDILFSVSPGRLTREKIGEEYLKRYKHLPTIGNRLRELRKGGLVRSFEVAECKRLLWGLTEDWKTH